MNLTSHDYKKIVKFYNLPKRSDKTYKEMAEDILSEKLCKCIKKVKRNDISCFKKTKNKKITCVKKIKNVLTEKQSIGICRNSIFKKRNIDFYKFSCKQSKKLIPKKHTRKTLRKFSKRIKFNKTKKS
tara:strand:- start:854 stop:1237 length:384 start_codon:yes stop_codon:yes gene_type:complete